VGLSGPLPREKRGKPGAEEGIEMIYVERRRTSRGEKSSPSFLGTIFLWRKRSEESPRGFRTWKVRAPGIVE